MDSIIQSSLPLGVGGVLAVVILYVMWKLLARQNDAYSKLVDQLIEVVRNNTSVLANSCEILKTHNSDAATRDATLLEAMRTHDTHTSTMHEDVKAVKNGVNRIENMLQKERK